jgi:basic membrane lipoprotein Med (substrate-binding protein (PBP1-ABC) superfamily)
LLIEQGADVIFTVTGPGYKGVWEAAQKAGVPVIAYAYDSYDIAPDVIAGSVTYDGPKQFLLIAEAYTNGTLESKLYKVGYDYIGIADFRGSIDTATENVILEMAEKIKNGEINVPEKMLTEQEMADAFNR